MKISTVKLPRQPLRLLRRTALRTDLRLRITRLEDVDDPGKLKLIAKLQWRPEGEDAKQGEMSLTPYFLKRGQLKTRRGNVVLQALAPEANEDRWTQFELNIPVFRRANPPPTTIGFEENGGTRFFRLDITDVIRDLE